jgi:hypothetical protein
MTTPNVAFETVPESRSQWGRWRTVAEPVLYGNVAHASYDWPLHRWIPASHWAVSPDGHQYAYVREGSGGLVDIHIVNVATGRDRVAATGDNFSPMAFNVDGLYISQGPPGRMWFGGGIFLLDPLTDTVRQVHAPGKVEIWSLIAGRFAYGARFNPADPMPAGMGEAPNELVRLDMTTGVIDALAYTPGKVAYLLGKTPDGRILAGLRGGIYFLDSQGQTIWITDSLNGAAIFSDDKETWFLSYSSPRHLYVLSGDRVEHVMEFEAYTNPNRYMSLAGGCH